MQAAGEKKNYSKKILEIRHVFASRNCLKGGDTTKWEPKRRERTKLPAIRLAGGGSGRRHGPQALVAFQCLHGRKKATATRDVWFGWDQNMTRPTGQCPTPLSF